MRIAAKGERPRGLHLRKKTQEWSAQEAQGVLLSSAEAKKQSTPAHLKNIMQTTSRTLVTAYSAGALGACIFGRKKLRLVPFRDQGGPGLYKV